VLAQLGILNPRSLQLLDILGPPQHHRPALRHVEREGRYREIVCGLLQPVAGWCTEQHPDKAHLLGVQSIPNAY